MSNEVREAWGSGEPYERYVGRWSRSVAREFLAWLDIPTGQAWADIGCGTGAIVGSILAAAEPQTIIAVDRSAGFIAAARDGIADGRVHFAVADATALALKGGACHVAVSGLVLNFVPDAAAMVREMVRMTRPGGTVALYVWDYAAGMEMMRHFWDVAIELSPRAAELDEATRFTICRPEPLAALLRGAGLSSVAVRPIDIPTVFQDFEDYWSPFLGRQGPAPIYLASLDDQTRDRLREILRSRLVAAADGSIALAARAWAARGTV